jgi:hypothetical protein
MGRRRHFWEDPAYPQRVWGAADWAAWKKAGSPPLPRGSRVQPKVDLDPTERLLMQSATSGPKISLGPPASQADKNRREANRLLEKFGLRPRRW